METVLPADVIQVELSFVGQLNVEQAGIVGDGEDDDVEEVTVALDEIVDVLRVVAVTLGYKPDELSDEAETAVGNCDEVEVIEMVEELDVFVGIEVLPMNVELCPGGGGRKVELPGADPLWKGGGGGGRSVEFPDEEPLWGGRGWKVEFPGGGRKVELPGADPLWKGGGGGGRSVEFPDEEPLWGGRGWKVEFPGGGGWWNVELAGRDELE
jgi:hypothetical protein